MSFTYDPTVPSGQVRLLCQDFDSANAIFQDSEIQAFLNLNSQDVRLAAAQALEVVAANQAFVLKRVTALDLNIDGTAVSKELRAQAAELRRQSREAEADGVGLFDFAEFVLGQPGYLERVVDDALRQSSG